MRGEAKRIWIDLDPRSLLPSDRSGPTGQGYSLMLTARDAFQVAELSSCIDSSA